MATDPIQAHVRQLRPLNEKAKRVYLQNLIGQEVDPVKCSHILHYRALLMTELRKAGVWPHLLA